MIHPAVVQLCEWCRRWCCDLSIEMLPKQPEGYNAVLFGPDPGYDGVLLSVVVRDENGKVERSYSANGLTIEAAAEALRANAQTFFESLEEGGNL